MHSFLQHIFLTDGASKAVQLVLTVIIRDSMDAVLCPIPQYPLYSASISLLGGTLLPYMLCEEKDWGLDLDQLRQQVAAARSKGYHVSIPFSNGKRVAFLLSPRRPSSEASL